MAIPKTKLREFVDQSDFANETDYAPCTGFCSIGFGVKLGEKPILALVSLEKKKLGGRRTGMRLVVQKAKIVPA